MVEVKEVSLEQWMKLAEKYPENAYIQMSLSDMAESDESGFKYINKAIQLDPAPELFTPLVEN